MHIVTFVKNHVIDKACWLDLSLKVFYTYYTGVQSTVSDVRLKVLKDSEVLNEV